MTDDAVADDETVDQSADNERLVVVKCAGCKNRYLAENTIVLSETVEDGKVIDRDDGLERCPFCGQPTRSSTRLDVRLEHSREVDSDHA